MSEVLTKDVIEGWFEVHSQKKQCDGHIQISPTSYAGKINRRIFPLAEPFTAGNRSAIFH